MVTIDNLIWIGTRTLKDLLKSKGGKITWSHNNQVAYSTDLECNCIILSYIIDGKSHELKIPYIYMPSNLGVGQVLFFVCPLTGYKCRKVYLSNGEFVSRKAFRHLYRKQRESHHQRLIRVFNTEVDMKHRKFTYRGKETPFGRKANKIFKAQNEAELELFSNFAKRWSGQKK